MDFGGLRIGVALTGSFCTFHSVIPQIAKLKELGADITPIMSETAAANDTRFGAATYFISTLENIAGKGVIKTIAAAEPIGPQRLLDALVIAPCTGNTISKLAAGITDTSVTMAAKAHMRNARPLVIAISTNDALGMSAKNIGLLLNVKNIYFVPFRQDSPEGKPNSAVADMEKLIPAVSAALDGRQLQPLILGSIR